MNSLKNFVFFLVSGVAFFVVACGNNPDKTRIFQDVSSSVLPKMSQAQYASASGQSFQVDAANESATFKVVLKKSESLASFDPEASQLTLSSPEASHSPISLQSTDVGDGFAPLLKIWQEHKEANPGASAQELRQTSPFHKPESLQVLCHETRSGSIDGIYKRPKDLTVSYSDFSTKDLFEQNQEAQWVMNLTIHGDQPNRQASHTLPSDSVLFSYLDENKVQAAFGEICAKSEGYDAQFQSFFANSSQFYGVGSNSSIGFVVPVFELSADVFKVAGFLSSHKNQIDDAVFSTNELRFDLSKQINNWIKTRYQSGQFEAVGDSESIQGQTRVKKFDNLERRVTFDWRAKTLRMTNMAGVENCRYDLKGAIDSVYYSTRRPVGLAMENSIAVDWTLQAKELSSIEDCPESLTDRERGESMTLHLQARRNGSEIYLHLLESQGKKELLSIQSLIEN